MLADSLGFGLLRRGASVVIRHFDLKMRVTQGCKFVCETISAFRDMNENRRWGCARRPYLIVILISSMCVEIGACWADRRCIELVMLESWGVGDGRVMVGWGDTVQRSSQFTR
jgi:hypothetical protein